MGVHIKTEEEALTPTDDLEPPVGRARRSVCGRKLEIRRGAPPEARLELRGPMQKVQSWN